MATSLRDTLIEIYTPHRNTNTHTYPKTKFLINNVPKYVFLYFFSLALSINECTLAIEILSKDFWKKRLPITQVIF